jgi:hypothetical protein
MAAQTGNVRGLLFAMSTAMLIKAKGFWILFVLLRRS